MAVRDLGTVQATHRDSDNVAATRPLKGADGARARVLWWIRRRRGWIVLGFAFTGESFIDGSHLEPATVSVVWAGFGWFTGIALATGLTRGAPPPSRTEAWALRAVRAVS